MSYDSGSFSTAFRKKNIHIGIVENFKISQIPTFSVKYKTKLKLSTICPEVLCLFSNRSQKIQNSDFLVTQGF